MVKNILNNRKIVSLLIGVLILIILYIAVINEINKSNDIIPKEEVVKTEGKEEVKETKVEEKEEISLPVDPNKLLSSGLTFAKVKELVDIQRGFNKRDGLSEERSLEILNQIAKEFGTTLEEVDKVIIEVPEPVYNEEYVEPVYIKEPVAPYNSGNGNTVTDWDKNGNGINDTF